jgi:hypothetical protein
MCSMRRTSRQSLALLPLVLPLLGACSSAGTEQQELVIGADAGAAADGADGAPAAFDASLPETFAEDSTSGDAARDVGVDAGDGCFLTTTGVFGTCMSLSACAALGDKISTAGFCSGPAGVECCTDAPDVGDNPPIPAGWALMQQANVTPAMTNWAVAILHDPVTYPMWSTAMQTFNGLDVLARVEWHAPDFQNNVVHRGVTLYEPSD